MLRITTIALALTGLIAAAPAHHQPTPASLPPQADSPDAAGVNTQSGEAAQDRNRRATEARDKAWDAKTKSTMSTICRGRPTGFRASVTGPPDFGGSEGRRAGFPAKIPAFAADRKPSSLPWRRTPVLWTPAHSGSVLPESRR